MSGQLVKYDAMCRAIAAAHKVDEVKEIRNKAIALETYARQALNLDAERKAAEIRIRAERRVGQLLKRPGAIKEGRPKKLSGEAIVSKLSDLGISLDQSSQWQKLAAISEGEFEKRLASAPDKPTTTGMIAEKYPDAEPIDRLALQVIGYLKSLERDGILALPPESFLDRQMHFTMRVNFRRLAPEVAQWLLNLGGGNNVEQKEAQIADRKAGT
jgi:hypothetical protein